ncbi:MAG: TIM barrel protein [Candidatus Woesearchaeota archaeon]
MKPLFLIPVNLSKEIELFTATKEKIESEFDVELGIEAIELYSEKEIDDNIRKLDNGEAVLDYDTIQGYKIGEIHSIFQRELLSSLTIRDNTKYLEHSLKTAAQIVKMTRNKTVNVNSHLSYFVPADDTAWFKANRQHLIDTIIKNYSSVKDLLSKKVSLTVENMDNSRWFKTENKLAIMPLDTSFHDLVDISKNVNNPNFGICLDIAHHQINQVLPDKLDDVEKMQMADCFGLSSFDDFAEFIGTDDYIRDLMTGSLVKSVHVSNFKGINILKERNEHGTTEGLLDIARARSFVDLAHKNMIPVTIEVPMEPQKAIKDGFFKNPGKFLELIGY